MRAEMELAEVIEGEGQSRGFLFFVAWLLTTASPAWSECTTSGWSSVTGTVQAVGSETSPTGKKYEGVCALTVDATTAPGYVTADEPANETVFSARFYLLADTLDLSSGTVDVFEARDGAGTRVRVSILEQAGELHLAAYYRNSGALQQHAGTVALNGAWQGVSLYWSADPGAGQFRLSLDGKQVFVRSDLDNGGEVVNQVDLGILRDPAATGKVVLDAFELRRSGDIPSLLTVEELFNISTRAEVGDSDRFVIAGFVVRGDTPKCVVVRGRGQSVPVQGKLTDPVLTLKSGQLTVDENDNWRDHATASIITDLGRQPTEDSDAALYACLDPGPYTVWLRRAAGSSLGVGIVEVIDADQGTSYLKNISTRANVGTAAPKFPIAGFIIRGDQPRRVLIRGGGPSLEGKPGIVSPVLANPTLTLKSGQDTVIENDDWKNAANQLDIQATGLAPGFDAESAILATLQPGGYTVWLQAANGEAGLGIVEVFDVDGASVELN